MTPGFGLQNSLAALFETVDLTLGIEVEEHFRRDPELRRAAATRDETIACVKREAAKQNMGGRFTSCNTGDEVSQVLVTKKKLNKFKEENKLFRRVKLQIIN